MATIAVLQTQPFTVVTPPPQSAAPRFTVSVGHAELALSAGPVTGRLAEWLQASGAQDFTVLTAANPHSFALSPEANRQRHRALVRALVFEGVRFAEAAAFDFAGEQPAVVAFNLGADRAAALGRAHAQGCVLFGDRRYARPIACETLDFQI